MLRIQSTQMSSDNLDKRRHPDVYTDCLVLSVIILYPKLNRLFKGIFNRNMVSGFYRVNYDDITWALITRALRSEDRLQIHEYNRAQVHRILLG